jgi:hypothetical protein
VSSCFDLDECLAGALLGVDSGARCLPNFSLFAVGVGGTSTWSSLLGLMMYTPSEATMTMRGA